jgi:hypothetical protein
MKYRITSLATGKKYKCSKDEQLHLMADGRLLSFYKGEFDCEFTLLGGYVIEFSFSKDSRGKNIWSECVMYQ